MSFISKNTFEKTHESCISCKKIIDLKKDKYSDINLSKYSLSFKMCEQCINDRLESTTNIFIIKCKLCGENIEYKKTGPPSKLGNLDLLTVKCPNPVCSKP